MKRKSRVMRRKISRCALADSIVFALTVYRALKLIRVARGGVRSLIDIIVRDGEFIRCVAISLPRSGLPLLFRCNLLRRDLRRGSRERAHLPGTPAFLPARAARADPVRYLFISYLCTAQLAPVRFPTSS